MTSSPENNKQFLTYKWLVPILLGIIVSVFGYWGVQLQERINSIETYHREAGSKVSSLESTYILMTDRLNRIEGKLDRLIEKR